MIATSIHSSLQVQLHARPQEISKAKTQYHRKTETAGKGKTHKHPQEERWPERVRSRHRLRAERGPGAVKRVGTWGQVALCPNLCLQQDWRTRPGHQKAQRGALMCCRGQRSPSTGPDPTRHTVRSTTRQGRGGCGGGVAEAG